MLLRTSVLKYRSNVSLFENGFFRAHHRASKPRSNNNEKCISSTTHFETPTLAIPLLRFNHVLSSRFCTSTSKVTSPPPNLNNKLLRKIKSSIQTFGPMTVAEYMRLVLTNSKHGYYMHNDVFGEKGDFTTSPEISQMFGELVGVWCVHEWMVSGKPSQFNVVEFGPGRGTLADDMLRVFKKFPEFNEVINLHFIEVSPKLKEIQQSRLCQVNDQVKNLCGQSESSTPLASPQEPFVSKTGVKVHWWNDLSELPSGPSFYVAHEFFDALPIHKFQKVDGKWREILVDYNQDKLRFVLSPSETVALAMLKEHLNKHEGDHLEVSPESLRIVREMSARIDKDGGFALVIDYGHLGDKGDTFRAFSKHCLVDPLQDPGVADLTADVNFDLIRSQCHGLASVHGPTSQADFLAYMGISIRLKELLQSASETQRKDLISGYDMLTNPDKMGERFKFMALMNSKTFPKEYKPAGFL